MVLTGELTPPQEVHGCGLAQGSEGGQVGKANTVKSMLCPTPGPLWG